MKQYTCSRQPIHMTADEYRRQIKHGRKKETNERNSAREVVSKPEHKIRRDGENVNKGSNTSHTDRSSGYEAAHASGTLT